MNSRLMNLGLAWLALLPAVALGDGGFIPMSAFERVQVPDQRALIHFADNRETLVIDTAFKGEGTNFAWIVPVPAVPMIEPATTGIFTTLQILFQPEIVHDVFPFYGLVIVLGLLAACVIWMLRRGRSLLPVLLLLLFLVLVGGLLLPAHTKASATALGSSEKVNIIERKRVGVYETATLASPDGQAVFDWLKQNGFVTPTNFIPAIRAYAQEGCYFVASKIQMDKPLSGGGKPHPLSLTFKTERPVYPLRLTGINNESCHVELYVFGPDQARHPYFQVERCTRPEYPHPKMASPGQLVGLRIRHPRLRALVEGSPVATKLVGRLTSRQMRDDAYLAWSPVKEKRLTKYSYHGAAVYAANLSIPFLMLGLLTLLICYWIKEEHPIRAKRICHISRWTIVAILAGWGTVYVNLPKIQVVESTMPGLRMRRLHEFDIPQILAQHHAELSGAKADQTKINAAWVRQQLAATSALRKEYLDQDQTNLWTGEPWREEDSPGNFMLRETSTNLDYLWYDLEGAERVIALYPEEGSVPEHR